MLTSANPNRADIAELGAELAVEGQPADALMTSMKKIVSLRLLDANVVLATQLNAHVGRLEAHADVGVAAMAGRVARHLEAIMAEERQERSIKVRWCAWGGGGGATLS